MAGAWFIHWPVRPVWPVRGLYGPFEIDSASITRGHKWKLKKKRINTNLQHHFFSDRIINWWNKLDDEVVCATSVNAFKNCLQRMWERDEFVFRP